MQNWRHHDMFYLRDSEAFLFSLDKNQKYMNKNTGNEINADISYGPAFGSGVIGSDLKIANNANQNN